MDEIMKMKRRQAMMRKYATCDTCQNYNEAPCEHVRDCIGWCADLHGFVLANDGAGECDGYDPRMDYLNEWELLWN